MNQEFPKAVRQALARQTAGDVHPSPDVLNAFVERSLTAHEQEQVTVHLATCAECREVLFLVNGVAEEKPVTAPANPPFRIWRRWRWVVPAVALLVIVTAVSYQRLQKSPSQRLQKSPSQRLQKSPSPPVVATNQIPQPSPASAPPASREIASSVAHNSSQGAKIMKRTGPQELAATTTKPVHGAVVSSAENGSQAQPLASAVRLPNSIAAKQQGAAKDKLSPTETAEPTQLSDAISQSLLKAAPSAVPNSPPRNSFQQEEAPPVGIVGGLAPAATSAVRLGSNWRITQNGHVERSFGGDLWMRVLADEPAAFRVVAVVRNSVWAGGDGGALFHSQDGGVSWSKVPLRSGNHVEEGNITAIQFNTPQQGRIVTESGSRWVSSDGGQTWTKQ